MPAVCYLSQLFAGIDIAIDARRLAEQNPSLSLLRLTPATDPSLSSILVPWFSRNGLPVIHRPEVVDHHHPKFVQDIPREGDRPLTLADAAASDHPHPWYKVGSILAAPPVTGCCPAYRANNKILLLDGNHRCISVIRSGANYDLDLIVIDGPADERIMHDLIALK